MEKSAIRTRILKERSELSATTVSEKSGEIMRRLEAEEAFQNAEKVLFYYSHGHEVYTVGLFEKWIKKKLLFLPKLLPDHQMEAVGCSDPTIIQLNEYGIPEPQIVGQKTEKKFDLILVPGVVFDKKGNRIGMGKGYYDRFLANHSSTLKIGLAYDFQIFDELPKDPYDVAVDIVITEKQIIHTKIED